MKPKVIVITKQTSYSKYIQDNDNPNVFSDVRELVEKGHPAVSRWKGAHEAHMRTLQVVTEAVSKKAELFVIDASASFVAELQDVVLVITVGGDGTLLSASHNIHGQIPILGVNSDPNTSVGFFCVANADNFEEYFNRALECTCKWIILTRMKVTKNARVIDERVLNDVLFCHTSPATTSNYILHHNGVKETQKSSGFWVGPAAGSTAARRSAGFEPQDLGSKDLQFCVRELYHRPGSEPGVREIIVNPLCGVRVISKMDSAAMYIDGDHKVVPVSLGDEIVFQRSDESLLLLGKPNVLRK